MKFSSDLICGGKFFSEMVPRALFWYTNAVLSIKEIH